MLTDFLIINLLASFACDLLKFIPSRFRGSWDDLLRDRRAKTPRHSQEINVL